MTLFDTIIQQNRTENDRFPLPFYIKNKNKKHHRHTTQKHTKENFICIFWKIRFNILRNKQIKISSFYAIRIYFYYQIKILKYDNIKILKYNNIKICKYEKIKK